MNIFITGGTGFLGEHLITQLQAEGSHTLYALARSDRTAANLGQRGVVAIPANLTDGSQLKDALANIQLDVVFHLAAEIASQRSKEKLRSANIDGTRNVYEAVKNHSELKRFIFASTVVTGEAHGELLEEDKPLVVETEYGRTKQVGEKILLEAFENDAFPAIVVRPCHIYGNGGWYGGIIHEIKKGSLRMPGNGKNMWDVAHVDDVAAAFIVAMKKGVPGEIYHVADDTPVTMGEFLGETVRCVGAKPPGRAPRFLANWMLGKDTITSVLRSARTSNKKMRGLGWEPQFPEYRSGLANTFEELAKTA